ncbi:hypothetical protein [Tuanshanicoccus lijuaniae]|uniref:hypothetical protein n=1 Tax=Aerococcaceae bacterium zg-1292 TaxID=2774330 RepID=UPI001BD81CE1|nr:hypothetical protein [Aerococcaceae bacterium zg-A91]MBS4458857.1 hypothetical protein [Aerococcaceae bacterium zg-BR33]
MKKGIKFLIVIILLLILVGLLKIYSNRSAVSVPTNMENSQTQMANQLLKKVEAFYANPQEKTFLREDEITLKELDDIKAEVETLNTTTAEKNKVLSELTMIEWKKEAQDAINNIYQSTDTAVPVIKGAVVQAKRQLVDSVNLEQVNQMEQQLIEKMPKHTSADSEQEPKKDEFNELVRDLVEAAKKQVESYDTAVSVLNDVEKIAIEDGQIGNIAKKLREFEAAQKAVTDKGLAPKLKAQADRYLGKFLAGFKKLAHEIPGYYDIALVAVEPSVLLTELLVKNQNEFVTTAVTEVETVTEIIEVEQVVPTQTERVEPEVTEALPSESSAEAKPEADVEAPEASVGDSEE